MSFPPVRTRLIHAARDLMRRRGFHATAVDEVVGVAGVAKGSVYHVFGSKSGLALAALEEDFSEGMEVLARGPHRRVRDPVERLRAFLDHVERQSLQLWSRGSLIGALSLELGPENRALEAHVARLFRRMEQGLAPLFGDALESRGVVGPTGEELAGQFVATVEGSVVVGRALDDWRRIPGGIAVFRAGVEALLAR